MSQTVVGNLAVELGMSTEEFQRALAHAQVQAQAAATKIQGKINQAASSGGGPPGGGGGMSGFALGFSRAVDDAQYGFRGIINNMEQIGTEAARSFGLSTASAMAFGSALTLTAIAVNNLMDDLEKMTDTRSEWQKLADGPTAFAGSIAFASDRLKDLQKQTQELLQKDATQGFGAFISRNTKALLEWEDRNQVIGRSGGLASFLPELLEQFNPQTMEQQVAANKAAGERIARNRVEMGIESVGANRNQTAFDAGLRLIGEQRAGDQEVGDEFKKAFALAAQGQAETIRDFLFNQNVAGGMGQVEAEQQAIKTLGDAANGTKEAFDELARKLPQLDLAGKLSQVYEAEAATNRQAFIDQQNKERERLTLQAEGVRERLSGLQSQRMRSEIVGSADVFARNLNAGTSEFDPVVKAIEKQTEEYKSIMERISALN